jgi:polysaccharide export outer membrane protein
MRFVALLLLTTFALVSGVFAQATLRPNDTFDLQLNGVPPEAAQDFRGIYTVGDDGNVGIPLLKGSMRAAGLTVAQFQKAIEQKLIAEKIFTNPTILINLQARTRFVTVGGAVRAPQAVDWSADMTLSAAIKRAGGTTEFGSLKKIRILRDGKTAIFNLTRADRDPNQNPKLLPGDEVEVPE